MVAPLLIAAIASAAAKATQGLPGAFKTEYDRREADRLQQLEQQMAEGALGLSEAEKAQLYRESAIQQQATEEQLERQRSAQMQSALGIGGGEALKAAVASEEQSRRIAEERAQTVQGADIARARELEDEYWARLANKSEQKRARQMAALGAGKSVAEDVEAYQSQKNTLEGAGVSNQQLKQTAAKYGISVEEMKSLFDELESSPEMAQSLSQIF